MSNPETRILIVEDEPLIAGSIAMHLLNTGFMISGIAYDDEEALTELKNNPPDAAILDINLESHERWYCYCRVHQST